MYKMAILQLREPLQLGLSGLFLYSMRFSLGNSRWEVLRCLFNSLSASSVIFVTSPSGFLD